MKTDSQSDSGLGFQSDDDRQENVDDKKGSTSVKDAKTLTGELVCVQDGNYFAKVRRWPGANVISVPLKSLSS